ncbi:MAG: ArsC/Spx/MgsR family protein [Chitinophagales bacterium]
MDKIFILHNNRCGKSRAALKLLEESGKPFEIINYLDGVLSAKDIAELLKKLNIKALELIRVKEDAFQAYKNKDYSEEEWLQILEKEPKLIERPILYTSTKALIGRPTEKVEEFLKQL